MQSLFQILMLLLNIVWFFIIAHVVMSWLINFQVLNLRQILPPMGGLDLAPLVLLVGVAVLRIVLMNNAAAFYY